MPTYQYRCTQCGRDLEVVQKFTDPALTTCPTCQGALRKVFNAVGVVFKGSGFYRTDSRAKDGDSGAKSEKKSESKGSSSEAKSNGSSDTSSNSGSSSSTGSKGSEKSGSSTGSSSSSSSTSSSSTGS